MHGIIIVSVYLTILIARTVREVVSLKLKEVDLLVPIYLVKVDVGIEEKENLVHERFLKEGLPQPIENCLRARNHSLSVSSGLLFGLLTVIKVLISLLLIVGITVRIISQPSGTVNKVVDNDLKNSVS